MSEEVSGGKCFRCEEPILCLEWVNGEVVIHVECYECGTVTVFLLRDALEALGKENDSGVDPRVLYTVSRKQH